MGCTFCQAFKVARFFNQVLQHGKLVGTACEPGTLMQSPRLGSNGGLVRLVCLGHCSPTHLRARISTKAITKLRNAIRCSKLIDANDSKLAREMVIFLDTFGPRIS